MEDASAHAGEHLGSHHKKNRIRGPMGGRIRFFTIEFAQYLKNRLSGWEIKTLSSEDLDEEQARLVDYDDSTESRENVVEEGAEGTDQTDDDGNQEYCIIYVRVSSDEQAEEGRSIESQLEYLKSVKEERDLKLTCDPIVDDGQSGLDFERAGIKEVFRTVQKEPVDYLLINDIDRLGRAHAQTIYFIHLLVVEHDVTIITKDGSMNYEEMTDKMWVAIKAISSEMEVEGKGNNAWKSRARGFIEHQQWESWYDTYPLGYEKDGNGWVQVVNDDRNSSEAKAAEMMFEIFNETGDYAETIDAIESRFGSRMAPSRGLLRSYLQREIYIGRPSIDIDFIDEHGLDKNWVDDSDLQLVDKQTFNEVQKILDEYSERYSSNSTTKVSDETINEFGLFPVAETSPMVKLVCRYCGGEVNRNGQEKLDGSRQQVYQCLNCEQEPRWPIESELNSMEILTNEHLLEKLLKNLKEIVH